MVRTALLVAFGGVFRGFQEHATLSRCRCNIICDAREITPSLISDVAFSELDFSTPVRQACDDTVRYVVFGAVLMITFILTMTIPLPRCSALVVSALV